MSRVKIEDLQSENQRLKQELSQLQQHTKNLEQILTQITQAKAFKVWQEYNTIKKWVIKTVKKIANLNKILVTEGPSGVMRVIRRRLELEKIIIHDLNKEYNQYFLKLKKNLSNKKNRSKFKFKPLISIITPVFNTPKHLLRKMIDSIIKQTYTNWELILIDDCSTNKETLCLMEHYRAINKKIKIIRLTNKKTIGYASNAGVNKSKGDFIYIVDSDDEIEPIALSEFVEVLNDNSKEHIKIIYTDEDRPNLIHNFVEPFIKPDWSPHLLLSNMYMTHFLMERGLFYKTGGFPTKYHTSHDYDLILKATEKIKSKQIYHIPKILYHWNNHSTAMSQHNKIKDWTIEANSKILKNALKRRGYSGSITQGLRENFWRIRFKIKNSPRVSIIIPNRNNYQIFKDCVNSIIENTDYKNYEIIIIDNNSGEIDIKEYYKRLKKNNKKKVGVFEYNKPFNFSKINNFAAKKAKGDYLVFLNNDTKVIKTNPDWIISMLELCQLKEVGAVGCLLLFPDHTIQHMGVVTGWKYNQVAGHVCAGKNPEMLLSYQNNPYTIRNWSAVTAACMMTKKRVFLEERGFNEPKLPVAFNDVDYCLRLRKKGFFIVYTPFARLYHYQSILRGVRNEDKERNYMLKKYGDSLYNDPYYSSHCRLDTLDFRFKNI